MAAASRGNSDAEWWVANSEAALWNSSADGSTQSESVARSSVLACVRCLLRLRCQAGSRERLLAFPVAVATTEECQAEVDQEN